MAVLIVASLAAQPANLARLVAEREKASRDARAQYTYRQEVLIEEMDKRGGRAGFYKETRDIVFLSNGERTEKMLGKPYQSLVRLRLTEEDFRDVREVQAFLFTTDELWLYETKFQGDETSDGVDCWVLRVRPRQTHQGQRLFDGTLWIDKRDNSVVKSEGVAVPQIFSRKEENLFPRFTTFREKVDGQSFPIATHSDDTLPFSTGPLRTRMSIKYLNYRKFGSSVTLTFGGPESK